MKILYIMDPICGWSYGNSSNFVEFYNAYKADYEFEVFPGGIKIEEDISPGGEDMTEYIKMRSKSIEALSNAVISEKYYDNLVSNPNYDFNSVPSSRAISTIKLIDTNAVIAYADKLQRIQFIDGKDNNNEDVLAEVAVQIGIEKNIFLNVYRSDKSLEQMTNDYKFVRSLNTPFFPSLFMQVEDKITMLGKGYMTVEEMKKSLAFCYVKLRSI